MNKKKFIPIILSVFSNVLIYVMTPLPQHSKKPKIVLRKNLTTMQIPVRSYYKWDSHNLLLGEKGEVLTKNGEILIQSAYVYTDETPSSEKTIIVTIQTATPVPLTINKNLRDDDFFILSKRTSNRVTKEKEVEELFF